MKKLFLIIAMIFATTLTSFADDERVSVIIKKKSRHPVKTHGKERRCAYLLRSTITLI